MSSIHVTLPDGSAKEVPSGSSPLDVAKGISPRLADAAIVAKVDGNLYDLKRPLDHDAKVEILTPKDPDALYVYRHSTAHLCAAAVLELFPETKLGIGPAIENGFYYDFDRPTPFTPEDLERLEGRMREIVAADYPMTGREVTRDEAIVAFAGNPYKAEIAREIPADQPITLYTIGGFTDLCRGGHAASTGRIGAFKLTSVAGAYWRGDEHNPMLQRIYGTAWHERAELDDYLARLEEAQRRDHRRLGSEL